MNIVRENLEDLTTLLKVTVGEADYNEAVDKSLRTYRRKANIPGFRPGMVPMGIINKMYRKGVVAEEAYRTASKACFDYIETEKLTTVGDMIPSQKQQPLDFDNDTEYEFVFEVGIAPEVQISLSKKDKVTKYTIRVEEKMREGYRSNFLRRFGRLVDVEKVEKEEALDVTLEQGDTKIEEAYVGLIGMSDEDRAPFVGKKVGDTMDVDIAKLYKTPSQRASVLGVKEAELEGMDPNYRLTITKIRKFAEPELNEEFFKTAFPDGGVKTAEEFEQYVTRQIEGDLARESGFLFSIDVRKFLLKKAALGGFPEELALHDQRGQVHDGTDREGFRSVRRHDALEPDPETFRVGNEARGDSRGSQERGQSDGRPAVRLLRHEPSERRNARKLRAEHSGQQGGKPQNLRQAVRAQGHRRGDSTDHRRREGNFRRRLRKAGSGSAVSAGAFVNRKKRGVSREAPLFH
jgi:hypothetical protein